MNRDTRIRIALEIDELPIGSRFNLKGLLGDAWPKRPGKLGNSEEILELDLLISQA